MKFDYTDSLLLVSAWPWRFWQSPRVLSSRILITMLLLVSTSLVIWLWNSSTVPSSLVPNTPFYAHKSPLIHLLARLIGSLETALVCGITTSASSHWRARQTRWRVVCRSKTTNASGTQGQIVWVDIEVPNGGYHQELGSCKSLMVLLRWLVPSVLALAIVTFTQNHVLDEPQPISTISSRSCMNLSIISTWTLIWRLFAVQESILRDLETECSRITFSILNWQVDPRVT